MAIDPEVRELAQGKNFAAFTSLLPGGSPMTHVMWVDCDENHILVNPLIDEGFLSVGCWPCTKKVEAGADPRSGRWAGTSKTECGINV